MKQPTPRLLVAGALMLLAQLAPQFAHAQYSWIDDKGTRVFSDRPPPPGTPAKRILKAPHRADPADELLPATGTAAAPSPAAAAAAKPHPPSLAEREADYKKRQAQREEDAKKAQDEASHKAAQQEMCDAARQEQAQLASGVRIGETSANGERSYVSDEERARRLARAGKALAACR